MLLKATSALVQLVIHCDHVPSFMTLYNYVSLAQPSYYDSGADTTLQTALLTITSLNHEQCFNVTLISDGLIEETENVTLSLVLNDNGTSIKDIAPNTTYITITNMDSKHTSIHIAI